MIRITVDTLTLGYEKKYKKLQSFDNFASSGGTQAWVEFENFLTFMLNIKLRYYCKHMICTVDISDNCYFTV